MDESIIIQKMISIGQHLEREEIFYSGAEADARALLEEIKQALTIPVVVGRSEQLNCDHEWKVDTFDCYGFPIERYCDKCDKKEAI